MREGQGDGHLPAAVWMKFGVQLILNQPRVEAVIYGQDAYLFWTHDTWMVILVLIWKITASWEFRGKMPILFGQTVY